MTTQATKEKSHYAAAWEAAQGRAGQWLPAWAARLRERAFETFEQKGFPTTDDEDWKYTNTAPIARATFALPAESVTDHAGDARAREYFYEESASSRLVFANGLFRRDLSSLGGVPEGVVVCDLRAALSGEHEPVVREHLGRAASADSDATVALNTAFVESGAFVYLPAGASLNVPLQLLFLGGDGREQLLASPRVLVVAGRGSSATIIESYEAASESAYFTNSVAEIFVGEGARVIHYRVQREGAAAFHVAATGARLARGGSYDLTTITLGARLSRHGINVMLAEEGAECWVDGLYLTGDGQHADTHSTIDHIAPRCASHQLYKGILDGKSRAVFNGKVFVRRDAQQTDARQTNKNLLLSPDARVDTKPQLEIFADDVKCSHGATVGQLEEEELFYLRSRGLHDSLARNLLTYGFAEELVAKLKIDSIRAQLDEAILNRLHARLEA
ncbi:MAG: Fe-S cluster assembly protein SufD [Acidobacteria bacterium]|nr:Fe-S cluster assembly protein SufD [Acidobacteriota bacterium]